MQGRLNLDARIMLPKPEDEVAIKGNVARARLLISGRVQGVFYRAETREAALKHRLTGWVRNRPDGGVEALLEGDKQDVEKVIDWCGKGPPAARVDEVLVNWEEPAGDLERFSIKY